jgi:hypothetical protein
VILVRLVGVFDGELGDGVVRGLAGAHVAPAIMAASPERACARASRKIGSSSEAMKSANKKRNGNQADNRQDGERRARLSITMVETMSIIRRIGVGSGDALRGADLKQPLGQ